MVGGHGAAERDQGVVGSDGRNGRRWAVEIGVMEGDTAFFERGSDEAGAFKGGVTESQDLHGRAATWKWLRPVA